MGWRQPVHFFLFLSLAFSSIFNHSEDNTALTQLIKNIDTTNNGAVIASPQKKAPDYYYHWVRDAAVVTNTIIQIYNKVDDSLLQEKLSKWLIKSLEFTKKIQNTPNKSKGLGEPKFLWNGEAFNDDWGRPQNDGPALRAISLINLSNLLIDEGSEAEALSEIYPLLKKDLIFITENWSKPCFDLWEEVYDQHFYTLFVQRKALKLGEKLAAYFSLHNDELIYKKQIFAIENKLKEHWNHKLNLITPSLARPDDANWANTSKEKRNSKTSHLDAAILLAINHGQTNDNYFSTNDSKVLSTVYQFISHYKKNFPINSNGKPGVALGRYPEDIYNGTDNKNAGAWFLITSGLSEFYSKLRKKILKTKHIRIDELNVNFYTDVLGSPALKPGALITTKNRLFYNILLKLRQKSEDQLKRVYAHSNKGHQSEQFDQKTGYQLSAADLTWSYAALLSARIDLETH